MKIIFCHNGKVFSVEQASEIQVTHDLDDAYTVSGADFRMSYVREEQVLVLPDSCEITKGQEVTQAIRAQAKPLSAYMQLTKEEAVAEAIGLLLRKSVAEGVVTDQELQKIAPVLKARRFTEGQALVPGDVFVKQGTLMKCDGRQKLKAIHIASNDISK